MRVRCVRDLPTPEQAASLNPFYMPGRGQVFAVDLGREYTVYCVISAPVGPLLGIRDEYDQLFPTPLCLFEIADASLPADWVARAGPDGALAIEPPSFHADYFMDLAEGKPETVADFRRVQALLEPDATARAPEA